MNRPACSGARDLAGGLVELIVWMRACRTRTDGRLITDKEYDIYMGQYEGPAAPDPDRGNLPTDTVYALNQRVTEVENATLVHDAFWRSLGPVSDTPANFIGGTVGSDPLLGSDPDMGSGNDVIRGLWGNDTVDGKGGNDVLYGGIGNDTIRGGTGDDKLVGGAGQDKLFGDGGSDTFCFFSAFEAKLRSADSISDFGLGDTLDLSGIDANTTTAGDQSFRSIGSAAFTGQAGEVRYTVNAKMATTIVEANINTDRMADFQRSIIGAFDNSAFIL